MSREHVQVSASRVSREGCDRPGADRSRFALARYAVGELLATGGGFRQGPLCVVVPSGGSSLLADLSDVARCESLPCLVTDGPRLGRDMDEAAKLDRWDRLRARFCKRHLIIVQRFEEIGGRIRQAAFRQLFDAADMADWCLGLANHPQSGSLEPDLAARLAAGLVVTMAGDETPRAGDGPTIARIIAATARQFGIASATLTGSGRSRTVARARSLAMLLARRLTDLSYEAIGRGMGGRDHTTAMHAARVTADRLATDDSLAADAQAIIARLIPGRSPASGSGLRGTARQRAGAMSVACRNDDRS